jgi:chromate transporter
MMNADDRRFEALIWVFAPLSLVSIGGGPSLIAEMQHQSVVAHGWITQREFADLFAISRVAPGPGALLAPLIGWQVAGWLGAFFVSLAFFLPSSLLVYAIARVSARWRGSQAWTAIDLGLAPITVGLVLAGGYAILRPETRYALVWTIALLVAVCRMKFPNLHPLVLIGLGAAAFAVLNS